jgi:BirA family transcriptional regulator, biotin operon repressor / biotin---[acetyl-CoA-carboxylase] ligase
VTTSRPGGIPEDIAGALAVRAARLGPFAARLVYLETTSSTNDIADRLAADGAAHGTVVVADAQESGRGRMGRTWFSPPGAGLYTSVVLRPEALSSPTHVNPAKAGFHEGTLDEGTLDEGTLDEGTLREGTPRGAERFARGVALASSVSLTAGVALAEGIRAASGLEVTIKWPNDLVVERRKLCGILAEASSRAATLQHVILGYGINIRPAAYPPDIAHRATSLETELGRQVDRAAVLAETLARLAEWLPSIRTANGGPGQDVQAGGGFDRMLNRWRELSPSSVGSLVEVLQPGGVWSAGTTAGIEDDGALVVSIGGVRQRVIAGEVKWV